VRPFAVVGVDHGEQPVEQVQPPVNVADGIDAPTGRNGTGRGLPPRDEVEQGFDWHLSEC
jgi:hypothetical protein